MNSEPEVTHCPQCAAPWHRATTLPPDPFDDEASPWVRTVRPIRTPSYVFHCARGHAYRSTNERIQGVEYRVTAVDGTVIKWFTVVDPIRDESNDDEVPE